MKGKVNQILLFILLGIIFLVAVSFLYQVFKPKKISEPTPPSQPTSKIPPTTAPSEIAFPTRFEPTMVFEKIVKEFAWEEVGPQPPAGIILSPVPPDQPRLKYSPGGVTLAELTSENLSILNASGSVKVQVPLSENLKQANFAWLKENLLLLIEKESDFWEVDKIYLIEIEKGSKLLLAGSFPIINRLNLTYDPFVGPAGNYLIFMDNGGSYWKFILIYQ